MCTVGFSSLLPHNFAFSQLEQKLRKNRVKSRLGFLSGKKQKEIRDTRVAKRESYKKKKYEAFKVKLVGWKAKEKADRKARWAAKQKK